MLCDNCFLRCVSVTSLTFESGSRLSRVEQQRFSETGLIEIEIPSSVDILDECCFFRCGSRAALTFGSGSRISRTQKQSFSATGLIEIPSSVNILGDGCFLRCESLPSLTNSIFWVYGLAYRDVLPLAAILWSDFIELSTALKDSDT
jgi:hypothetical protein